MKKILVPVDGSPASKKAAEKAVKIAKAFNSEITFINVIYVPDSINHSRYGLYSEYDLSEMISKMDAIGKKILDSVINSVDCEGLSYKKSVISGQPYEEVLKVAVEGNYDLIVMGRRGFSKIKRFFVGSVTERVISDSPCPVLVVQE